MSQRVGTRYERELRQLRIQPIYLVTFEGIPTRFSTAPIKNELGPTKQYLTVPNGAGSQITPDEGRASLGSMTFSLLDYNTEITYLAFLYQLGNRIVTLKQGFQDLDESEYVLVYTGRILDYTLINDNVYWQFQVVNLLKDERKDIFRAFTKLTAPATGIAVTLTVEATALFPTATAGVLYLKIDDEVISYTGKTATTFTGCSRGQLGTVAAAHSADAQVVNLVRLTGNPLTLALQILTSTGAGTNGTYDVLPACAGLAIDQDNIDVERFESERDRWVTNVTFLFEEIEKMNGKVFLEQQLYTFSNAYPTTTNAGKISVKVYSPPLPSSIAEPLDDDTLIGPPSYQGNVLERYFFNEVDASYDWDFRTHTFLSRSLYENTDSQTEFGSADNPEIRTRTFLSRGLRTATTGQSRINRTFERFLRRFSVPSPILGARAFFSKRLLESGDVLPLTSAFIPNLATGRMGIDSMLVEVINASPDYNQATQGYMLLNTGYSYGRKYAGISPSSAPPINFPVWSAATPAQRNYAFISREVSPTVGVMSDGSPGYYITD